MPYILYGVREVADSWNVTTERVRQMVKAEIITPDCIHQHSHQVYWYTIPDKPILIREYRYE